MAYLQYDDPKIVMAKCPLCHKKSSVLEWDTCGRKEWKNNYESMHGVLISRGPGSIGSLIYSCPACQTRIWESKRIEISIFIPNNREALQFLKNN